MRSEEQSPAQARTIPLESRASRLSLIVAMASNRVIGANNSIPWRLPGELQMFKAITMAHHIIMGRNTWESIARLLPGRTTVVVTRQRDYRVPGAIVAATLEDAIAACRGDTEVFVIGGAQLYVAALPLADRIYLTTVDAEVAGDTFMPAFDIAQWSAGAPQRHRADEKNPYDYTLTIYDRN